MENDHNCHIDVRKRGFHKHNGTWGAKHIFNVRVTGYLLLQVIIFDGEFIAMEKKAKYLF